MFKNKPLILNKNSKYKINRKLYIVKKFIETPKIIIFKKKSNYINHKINKINYIRKQKICKNNLIDNDYKLNMSIKRSKSYVKNTIIKTN